ncbi:MAG TPA: glycerol-3-phosphate dehydrogenase/oxidase [Candidatus Angelobacter sp.]
MPLTCPARTSLDGQGFDVLVIGGGVNGIAIARECARSGKKVAVIEQNDFASGASSRSTRIIHGGLRYLEHGEIALVRESLRERDRLLRRYPNLVRPMEFLLALSHEPRPFMRSAIAIRTGLWLYHRWAGAPRIASNCVGAFERQLDAGHRWSVFSYEDAQCEFPERLIAEWLAEAAAEGAIACNYTQVLDIARQNGRVTGARLRDGISGRESQVAASHIVNASGPWVDFVLQDSGFATGKLIGGVRGSHIVLPRFIGAPGAAIYTEATDGRPFFVIPWNGQTLVGTTEVADSADPAKAHPTAEEIDYLFDNFTRLFPGSRLTKADIRYSFAGIRPLPYSPGKKMSEVTRQHLIYDHTQDGAAGLISIIGGKLTTAMALARETARKLSLPATEPANILAAPAPAGGIESTLEQWARLVAAKAHIPEASAHAIAAWHGRRALAIASAASLDDNLRSPLCSHSEHIVAEAVEAVMHESAVTLADILLRRVPVALGPCWSESCTRQAASRIGAVLGWDRIQIYRESERFEQERGSFLHPKPEPVRAS